MGHDSVGELSIHQIECVSPTIALESASVKVGKGERIFVLQTQRFYKGKNEIMVDTR
jgi:hypothetical protein